MVGQILMVVVLPAVAGTAAIALLWSMRTFASQRPVRDGLVCAVAGLVLAWAFAAAVGVPSFPPEKMWHGLFHLALACALIGGLVGVFGPRQRALVMFAAAAAAACSVWLLELPDAAAGVSALSLALVIGVLAAAMGSLESSGGGLVAGVAAWAALAGVSVCAVLSNQPSLSMGCGALAVLAAGAVVLNAICSRRRGGAMVIGSVAIGALIGAVAMTGWAYDYGDVTWWQWLLVCVGIPAAAACVPSKAPSWSTGRRWIGVVLAVAPPIIAVCSALTMQEGLPIGP